MVRVLGRVTSINVRKVLWTLDELGISYEREDWGLPLRDPKVPEYLALNPNGSVPVFVEDDGFVLWESNAVAAYLAHTRGALPPSENHALARALQWLSWQATELNPPWMYALHALVRKTPGYDDPAKLPNQSRAGRERWTFSKPNWRGAGPSSPARIFPLPTSFSGCPSTAGLSFPSTTSPCRMRRPITSA